jgi:carbon monoxide dehydrogenase subunit G
LKFLQEFIVDQPVDTLWAFFDQPEQVAYCIPGVETLEMLDPETSATFEAKVHITEKVQGERIAFTATGSAVRGAVGNFRAESVVRLIPQGSSTEVRVESEAALAGVLGSVGQKVIAKQAEKITGVFAQTLQDKLSGKESAVAATGPVPRPSVSPAAAAAGYAMPAPVQVCSDGWGKVAAALGAVNVAIGLAILVSLT